MTDDEICPVVGKTRSESETTPDCTDIAGRQSREALEDQALAMRERADYYYEIAEQLKLGNPPNPGTAYRLVQRALWRRTPDEATAKAIQAIDGEMIRLAPRVRKHDPDALLKLRNLAHERLALTQPAMADSPLPQVDAARRRRDRDLRNGLRAMAREDAKLLESIPQASPDELARDVADLGGVMRNGLPSPPRRRGGRR